MKDYIKKVSEGIKLTSEEAEDAMKLIMSGESTDAQNGAFLTALKIRGETASEIASFAKVMREYAEKINPKIKERYVDVCGTGGDHLHTINISTTAMFIVAGAGIPVAKHGNRSITSKSGSADLLEALGAKIDLGMEKIEKSIEDIGIGFMFAPLHHPAMKHVMPARKQIGIRTVFNILGPLTNPANAKAQLMGVFDFKLIDRIAEVFKILGSEQALVVHGDPGLDEISTIGATRITELNEGVIKSYRISPEELGLKKAKLEDIHGGTPEENAGIARNILSGKDTGPRKDIVMLNAAGGILVGGKAEDLKEGLDIARDSIESGKANEKLVEFIEYTNR